MDLSLDNLIAYVGLGLLALGVAGVSFIGIRAFETASRRKARLAVGVVATPGGTPTG